MAGRNTGRQRPVTYVQSPDVPDPAMQRAFDVLTSAVKELQSHRLLDLFTETEAGYVPAAGPDTDAVLHADGVWRTVGSGGSSGVSSVTAGSNMVTVSPATGDVVVDVVPANFTGIPQSAVTNLEADLLVIANDITSIEGDIVNIQTDLAGKIDEVIAGTNLSGGGTSGAVTLDVVDNPTFAGDVTIGGVLDLNNNLFKMGSDVDGAVYLIGAGTNNSSINFEYGTNATANGYLNRFGYQGGTTQFRNLSIRDGKNGEVMLLTGSSKLVTFRGGAQFQSFVWLGNDAADAHKLVGTLELNATSGSNGQVAQIVGGFPVWASPSSAGIPTGSGTTNYVPKWTSANTIGDSNIEDDGTTVAISNANLTVSGNVSLGNASTDAHTANGTLDITGPSNDDVLTVTTTGAGVTTTGKVLVHASRTGTFLTSIEGTSKAYGVLAEVSMSEEGSGTTRNIAGRFVAEDGDENIALELLGDVEFDYRLGGSRIYSQGGLAVDAGGANLNLATDFASIVNINTGLGVTNVAGALNVSGNVTLGDSSGDAHVLNGTLNVNGTAGTNGQVLQIVSGVPQWGTLSSGSVSGLAAIATSGSASDLITGTVPAARMPALTGDVTSAVGTVATTISNNAVTNTKLRDSAALSVIGRASNSAGDPADITADTDGHVLRRSGTTLGFGTIPQSSVTNLTTDLAAKLPAVNVSGTSGKLAKFTGSNSVGDSIITESGSAVAVAGALSATNDIESSQYVTAISGYKVGSGAVGGLLKIGHQIFTSSGTYTPTTGTKAVRLRMTGGGGGGGGAKGGFGTVCAAGGGGSSGVYLEAWISNGSAVIGGAVTVGTGGAGGDGFVVAAGNDGGSTSVAINGTTYIAPGGKGGGGMGSGTSLITTPSAPVPSLGSSGDFVAGEPGAPGVRYASNHAIAGHGGSNPLGIGGAIVTVSTGQSGRGYGAGGSGGVATSSSTFGGAGAPGIVIIEEYA